METWEYMAVSIDAHTDWQTGLGLKKPELADEELQNQLNRWGSEGWECFSVVADEWHGAPNYYTVTRYHAVFKRRKP